MYFYGLHVHQMGWTIYTHPKKEKKIKKKKKKGEGVLTLVITCHTRVELHSTNHMFRQVSLSCDGIVNCEVLAAGNRPIHGGWIRPLSTTSHHCVNAPSKGNKNYELDENFNCLAIHMLPTKLVTLTPTLGPEGSSPRISKENFPARRSKYAGLPCLR
jgi:hypothetical protein